MKTTSKIGKDDIFQCGGISMTDSLPIMVVMGLNRALKVVEEDIGTAMEELVFGKRNEELLRMEIFWDCW